MNTESSIAVGGGLIGVVIICAALMWINHNWHTKEDNNASCIVRGYDRSLKADGIVYCLRIQDGRYAAVPLSKIEVQE